MIYLELFWSFFQIGLCSVGGGYAAIPLIQNQIVDLHHWMTATEFVDVVTISQMTPGPIAINAATFVGIQIAGIAGAIVATVGCVLPSCIIVLTLALLYQKYEKLTMVQGILHGLRPAVVALIATAGMSVLLLTLFGDSSSHTWADIRVVPAILFFLSLLVLRLFKINAVYVILGAGAINLGIFLLTSSGG